MSPLEIGYGCFMGGRGLRITGGTLTLEPRCTEYTSGVSVPLHRMANTCSSCMLRRSHAICKQTSCVLNKSYIVGAPNISAAFSRLSSISRSTCALTVGSSVRMRIIERSSQNWVATTSPRNAAVTSTPAAESQARANPRTSVSVSFGREHLHCVSARRHRLKVQYRKRSGGLGRAGVAHLPPHGLKSRSVHGP